MMGLKADTVKAKRCGHLDLFVEMAQFEAAGSELMYHSTRQLLTRESTP